MHPGKTIRSCGAPVPFRRLDMGPFRPKVVQLQAIMTWSVYCCSVRGTLKPGFHSNARNARACIACVACVWMETASNASAWLAASIDQSYWLAPTFVAWKILGNVCCLRNFLAFIAFLAHFLFSLRIFFLRKNGNRAWHFGTFRFDAHSSLFFFSRKPDCTLITDKLWTCPRCNCHSCDSYILLLYVCWEYIVGLAISWTENKHELTELKFSLNLNGSIVGGVGSYIQSIHWSVCSVENPPQPSCDLQNADLSQT